MIYAAEQKRPDVVQRRHWWNILFSRQPVTAVGPGRLLESGERCAVAVGVGDEILFGKYGGTDIEVDGVEVKILRESDILAKLG